MLYITCALYVEAKYIIKQYGLKRSSYYARLQVFENEKIKLLITGCGKIKAAMSVSSWLEIEEIEEKDLFINLGIAASADRENDISQICVVNKIEECMTGYQQGKQFVQKKQYYTDIIYEHPFLEKRILTVDMPSSCTEGDFLYDMEAAGVYQAAANYFRLHRIFIIKVISDYGCNDEITSKDIEHLMEKSSETVMEWAKKIPVEAYEKKFTKEEEALIQRTAEFLELSVTMQHEFRQKLYYLKLQKMKIEDIIVSMGLPQQSVNKKEGKKYLERLEQFI